MLKKTITCKAGDFGFHKRVSFLSEFFCWDTWVYHPQMLHPVLKASTLETFVCGALIGGITTFMDSPKNPKTCQWFPRRTWNPESSSAGKIPAAKRLFPSCLKCSRSVYHIFKYIIYICVCVRVLVFTDLGCLHRFVCFLNVIYQPYCIWFVSGGTVTPSIPRWHSLWRCTVLGDFIHGHAPE